MRDINPDIAIETHALRADEALLSRLVAAADVVVDCCDNFATRHAVNRACVRMASRWWRAPRSASTAS
jgi:molybdopterin/thiamine biosynthesis adenylyltransferase